MNNDYLMTMLLEKIEQLEKRVAELEKGGSSKESWYDVFIEVLGKYVAHDRRWGSEILRIAGYITPQTSDSAALHVRVATQMMRNDTNDHSKEIYFELKKATML